MSDIFYTEPTQSNAPNPVLQIVKAFCYFALLLGMQVIAIWGVMFYFGFQKMSEDAEVGIPYDINDLNIYMTEKTLASTNLILIIYSALFVLFLLLFFAARKKNFFRETQIKKFAPRYLPAVLIISVGLMLVINGVLTLLPASWTESYDEASSFVNEGSFGISLLTKVLLAPIVEELTFRGLMLSRLNKALPKWLAIAISSILFGVIHGNFLWFCYAALLGVILCLVVNRTGSLLSTIMIHMLFNFYGVALSYLAPELSYAVVIIALIVGIPILALGFYLLFHNKKMTQTS